ncbi:sugar nucleotide-binding protein [Streptomyces gardneri]|uniref:sugar nucleotide-binding protein n=1 Tax=Streptomyces gardneri TaxID=66892 RepID=UPI0038B4FDA1
MEVVALLGLDPELVRPIGSEKLGRPAVRPARSTLSQERWVREGFSAMRHWRAALHAAWPTLGLETRRTLCAGDRLAASSDSRPVATRQRSPESGRARLRQHAAFVRELRPPLILTGLGHLRAVKAVS